ncbi:uncharacterized protein LOC125551140 [Triticum urartu]|uniref:CCHC-type domain-containing protein n=1 Tax=Triticum urartu TaxID=4572 RepID=A0A8R7Q4N0_TRIUA|nr:uncharacterized protein LOC125551140 [Triticum urartu]
MSSAATYAESIASCRTPVPIRSPSLAATAAAVPDAAPLPVRRQLDFPSGDGNTDDDDDFFYLVAEEIEEMERNLDQVTRRAAQSLTPPTVARARPNFRERLCICRRGPCAVEWKEGGWAYVCSAPLKCRHSSYCMESDVNPSSQPAFLSHHEPDNHMTNGTTQVNVSPQGAGATTPVNVTPQRDGARTPVTFSPQGARSSGEVPTCKCTAGKCKTEKKNGVVYYVCHIPKGQGACSHREPVEAAAEEPPLTGYTNPRESEHLGYNPVAKEANVHAMMGGHNETRQFDPDQPPEYDEWPFEIVEGDVVPTAHLWPPHPTPIAAVAQGSPVMLRQQFAMVQVGTPTKSPMPPKCTISPNTPRSGSCYRCHEEGHWTINCPKNGTCYHCGMVGHFVKDCPGVRTQK